MAQGARKVINMFNEAVLKKMKTMSVVSMVNAIGGTVLQAVFSFFGYFAILSSEVEVRFNDDGAGLLWFLLLNFAFFACISIIVIEAIRKGQVNKNITDINAGHLSRSKVLSLISLIVSAVTLFIIDTSFLFTITSDFNYTIVCTIPCLCMCNVQIPLSIVGMVNAKSQINRVLTDKNELVYAV